MPYITKEDRDTVDYELTLLISRIEQEFADDDRDGVLNYCVTRLVAGVLKPETGWRYRLIARAVAVFECAKLEFYRMIAGNYENIAMIKNGDIPEYHQSHDEFLKQLERSCQPPSSTTN